jgi:hypothetical protein
MRYQEILEACWKGYRQAGMKDKGGRQVPNCVPVSEQEMEEDLKKWFKEKWVRFGPDGKIRGDCARGSSSEGKPKCLPQAKAQALGKKGRASSAAKKRREDPNPERRGAAKNVATRVNEFAPGPEREDDDIPDRILTLANRWWNAGDKQPQITNVLRSLGWSIAQVESEDDAVQLMHNDGTTYFISADDFDPDVFEQTLDEKQDACYSKVKSRYKVWPSAYASGALVQCRKKGAANWGNKSKK